MDVSNEKDEGDKSYHENIKTFSRQNYAVKVIYKDWFPGWLHDRLKQHFYHPGKAMKLSYYDVQMAFSFTAWPYFI